MKKTGIGVGIAIIAVAIGSFAVHKINTPVSAGEYNAFAECLTDKGVTMYGAWWCPHCQNQKKLFGSSFNKVRSVECAQPGNPNAQTRKCQEAKINGYPTWIFADGSRTEGEMSFDALSKKTDCTPPATK